MALDNDVVSEVRGSDKKRRVRGMGSHVTKMQLKHLEVAQSKEIPKKQPLDLAEQKMQELMTSCLKEVVGEMMVEIKAMIVEQLKGYMEKNGSPCFVGTPESACSSHQSRFPGDNVDNIFNMETVDEHPVSPVHGVHDPEVLLINKKRRVVAKGLLATDSHKNICRHVLLAAGEKKVWITEVYDENEPPLLPSFEGKLTPRTWTTWYENLIYFV